MSVGLNPIPGGWCSDPSIVRVGDDYYIAASTFEWMPGVNLFHSRDLIHWEQLPSALTDDESVDMEGLEPSCCIWAPNLTHKDGVFYLAYTIVQTSRYRFKDTHNYLVTATDICGPWSKPSYLHSIGFDPSVFHDDDGRTYIISQTMEHRTDRNRFQGVTAQECDLESRTLIGKPRVIFSGTDRGTTEGPNVMKKDGWYYITAAEGGTEFGHCVTVARSRNLDGPYEVMPDNPMLSSTGSDCALQRAGHGQFFTDPMGNWYMAHLCARPLEGQWSVLGRECAIQNIDWLEGEWPHLMGKGGCALPETSYRVPDAEPCLYQVEPEIIQLGDGLPTSWMTLRRCWPKCGISFDAESGWMRVTGGNSLCSHFRQHLAARRVSSLDCDAAVEMRFSPRHANHMAGLVVMYNCDNWHYLAMSLDDDGCQALTISSCENGTLEDLQMVRLPEGAPNIVLHASIRAAELRFGYEELGTLMWLEPVLDMRILSDEHVSGNGFTSAMIGVCCQDLQGDGVTAEFGAFTYRNGKQVM